MIITWLGQSAFKIQDKIGSDGVTVMTDPYGKETGLKMPNLEADIVTMSHGSNNKEILRGNPFLIDCAGEYDTKGVMVEGVDSFHGEGQSGVYDNNVIYRIDIDDMTIVHLGDLDRVLEDNQLEKLAGTDILLIPVGGKTTLDAKKAIEVISQIEPRIVIPMHYKIEGLADEGLDSVEKFVKELGVQPSYEEKLKISKKDLPQEDMELVILSI